FGQLWIHPADSDTSGRTKPDPGRNCQPTATGYEEPDRSHIAYPAGSHHRGSSWRPARSIRHPGSHTATFGNGSPGVSATSNELCRPECCGFRPEIQRAWNPDHTEPGTPARAGALCSHGERDPASRIE